MAYSDIEKALLASAQTQLGAIPVSWPNKLLDPPDGMWAAVYILIADDRAVTSGERGENEVRGILQIDLNVNSNSGDGAIRETLGELKDHYTPGRAIERNGQYVTVVRAVPAPASTEGRSYRQSLSIYFYARYQRPALS